MQEGETKRKKLAQKKKTFENYMWGTYFKKKVMKEKIDKFFFFRNYKGNQECIFFKYLKYIVNNSQSKTVPKFSVCFKKVGLIELTPLQRMYGFTENQNERRKHDTDFNLAIMT